MESVEPVEPVVLVVLVVLVVRVVFEAESCGILVDLLRAVLGNTYFIRFGRLWYVPR